MQGSVSRALKAISVGLCLTATVIGAREFLAPKGHAADEVDRMHRAWTKAVLLQITLWSRPYAREELW